MTKAQIREQQLQLLCGMAPEARAEASRNILECLGQQEFFIRANHILLYAPLPNEPDLLSLLDAMEGGDKCYYFPKVTADALTLHLVHHSQQLVPGPGRLMEPEVAVCPEVPLATIDLAIIPGLAFDGNSGVRLGRGGGYYDRLLARAARSLTPVGVCFEMQLLANLPADPWDVPMHGIVSPQGFVLTKQDYILSKNSENS